MPNISFNILISYLEELADKHVDIKSHFRWNISEVTGAMRSGIEYPVMAIDSPEVSTSGDRSSRFHYNSMAFTILAKPENIRGADKYAEQNQVLNECLQICYELEKRIVADSALRARAGEKNWLYNLLDINSFNFQKIGPIYSDGLFGYRCELLIKNSVPKGLDASKWTDISPEDSNDRLNYKLDFVLS